MDLVAFSKASSNELLNETFWSIQAIASKYNPKESSQRRLKLARRKEANILKTDFEVVGHFCIFDLKRISFSFKYFESSCVRARGFKNAKLCLKILGWSYATLCEQNFTEKIWPPRLSSGQLVIEMSWVWELQLPMLFQQEPTVNVCWVPEHSEIWLKGKNWA